MRPRRTMFSERTREMTSRRQEVQDYLRLCHEYNRVYDTFLRNQYTLIQNAYRLIDNVEQPTERRQTTTDRITEELTRLFPRSQFRTFTFNLTPDQNIHTLFSNMEDVPVVPSSEQIRNAVEETTYAEYKRERDGDHIIENCPIDLHSFEDTDTILRIKECGHIFKKENLLQWFSRNTRCPVCRYDIREYSNTDISNNITPEPINDHTYMNIFRTLFPDISFSTVSSMPL